LPSVELDKNSDREMVGEIAETCAVTYEKNRLTKRGYPELSMLVQQISLVDRSAGYDILSYSGIDKKPESPIFIEVKGTKNHKINFIWSRNERLVARRERSSYWIYAFTKVEIDKNSAKGPTRIKNPIVNLERLGYNTEALDVHIWA
jgi:hypothetical protein